MANKILFTFFTCMLQVLVCGQALKEYEPIYIYQLDFSPEMIRNFNSDESFKKCEAIYKKWKQENRDYESATKKELEVLKYCDEIKEDVWDAVGGGCSWYCNGGPKAVSASSHLKQQGKITYAAENAHDLDYKTVWAEGAEEEAIGEYLLYTFEAASPRITTVIVVNGYVKSKEAWKANSRVKKLKVYFNNKAIAILNLKDTIAEQGFDLGTLGYERDKNETLKQKPDWTLKFEILETYPGEKYSDVVISEIFFDGIDVHCLAKGTQIRMADLSQKPIEELKKGDCVLSYNGKMHCLEQDTLLELATTVHRDLIEIQLADSSLLRCTKDHPLMGTDGNWYSFDPAKTMESYLFEHVRLLTTGVSLKSDNENEIVIRSIQELPGTEETYTIVKLSRNSTFIANGIIVGTEQLRKAEVCKF